jgi:hypothetical protein
MLDLIFVKPRFEVYKAISRQIREIFAEHTPITEPLSLDEAYLDVTENLQGILLARDIALRIREKIKAETGLNASAGVSYNKFLAKLASDHRKPNGQYVISPEMGPTFVETLPVGKFHGIGPATATKFTPSDLDRPRHSQPVPLFSTGELRQVRHLLLLDFARHRRTPCTGQSHPQIGWRREHVLCRSQRIRRDGGGAPAVDRQGLATLRGGRHPGANGDTQGEVRRLRNHHAQPIRVWLSRTATISRVWRSGSWKMPCPFQRPCASWECRCLLCKVRTTRSRNWISGSELIRAPGKHPSQSDRDGRQSTGD